MIKKIASIIDQINPAEKWRWLMMTIFLKGAVFLFLAFYFQKNWEPEKVIAGIAIHSGDTNSYLRPILDVVAGNGYTSICRMPGILPIYGPLAAVFGAKSAEAFLVIIQFLFASLAVYITARWAFELSRSKRAFLATLVLMSLSTFVAVWDHYIYMESFAVSALVIGLYLLHKASQSLKWSFIWGAGFLLAWCVFLRPILIMVLPIAALYVFFGYMTSLAWMSRVKRTLIFVLPLIVFVAAWSSYTKARTGERIFLQGSFEQCYRQMPEHHLHLRDLMIAWGGDFQEWSENTEFAWFIRKKENTKFHFPDRVFTSAYNLDSLKVLRENYQLAAPETDTTSEVKALAMAKVIDSSDRFLKSFKEEKTLDFYLKNRALLLKKFIVPGHVDNLPFLSVNQMSPDQLVVKLWSVILFHLVFILGTTAAVYLFFTQMKSYFLLSGVALATIFLLGPILGYIEQRYLVPAYPLLLICLVNAISFFFARWKVFQAK